jgi:hypothetical protein
MLLGFVFAWLLIALSQGGEAAVMTPVTALWLFALPLMDTVGVMLRRIWLGKSPFRADRHHLHHLLVRAGFRVCDVVAVAVLMQFVFASDRCRWPVAAGSRVPDVLAVHRRFRRLFPGHRAAVAAGSVVAVAESARLACHRHRCVASSSATCAGTNGDEHLIGKVQRDVSAMKKHFLRRHGVDVRLFIRRQDENDLRSNALLEGGTIGSQRRHDERRSVRSTLIYSMERGGGMMNGGRSGLRSQRASDVRER